MNFRLIAKLCQTYGVLALRGKALAAFLFLTGPALADPVTVLALGDSLTQGYGLPQADGFVPQLESWLRARGAEVDIINGGVSGDTSAGGAARVSWSLTEDVEAMIVTLGGNDLLRGIDPGVTQANLERILDVAQAGGVKVLLVGMRAPGNYGPEYKVAFDAIYLELAKDHNILFFSNFFDGLGEVDSSALREFFQPDGIHPNAVGVQRIVAAIGPVVLDLINQAK